MDLEAEGEAQPFFEGPKVIEGLRSIRTTSRPNP